MKAGLKQYYKPTPSKLRKLGDALLASALFAAPYADGDHLMLKFILIAGIAGKFLTNFFADN
jgi:hypothetical protein